MFLGFGERFLSGIISWLINVVLVRQCFFPLEFLALIAGEKVLGKCRKRNYPEMVKLLLFL
jgi:hypothetical protein